MIPKVTILIPTRFDSRWHLALCLRTIRKYTEISYRLIVGDAGVGEETKAFLGSQEDVQVIPCPEPLQAKDTLARAAQTPFFLFQHDDTMVLRTGWLKRRLAIMERAPRIGILGVTSPCFVAGWRRYIPWSVLDRRFLPLCMLVRKAMQDDLDLLWGLYKPFDTGSIAYLQYCKQSHWRFHKMKFDADVKHWGRLAWIRKKSDVEADPRGPQLLAEREARIEEIRVILKSGQY